jgi:hypothetical protein
MSDIILDISCYKATFYGDFDFNADVGSAGCDFPGGDSHELFNSVHKLLDLPENYKVWTDHDYTPGGEARKEPLPCQAVAEQAKDNKQLKKGVPEQGLSSGEMSETRRWLSPGLFIGLCSSTSDVGGCRSLQCLVTG